MRSFLALFTLVLSTTAFAQDPVLTVKLTDAYPLEMAELRPYLLFAEASIDEPESITDVLFSVEGTDLSTIISNGAYAAWWTPASYGAHIVTVTTTASNGHTAAQSVVVTVSNTIADRTVATLDGAVIDWGSLSTQWYNGSYTLPQFAGGYDQIMAHLTVTCPSVTGGCDDWDRLAYVEARAPNGDWVEIIRYVTPYGVPCDHSIDVTDFASVLQGNTEIRMYIDTWGTGGWKMDLDLTYSAGTPTYIYSTVQKVWRGNYNFGDPADLQPVDTVMVDAPEGTESASLRLVTTGHGWGQNNTNNAAEFYHATHHVNVNGQNFTQDLWTDCNPNPDGCSPQGGTWQYDRAGWCPGSIAPPYTYDLTPLLGQGPLECAYTFQTTYVDQCHPNNPNCVSGNTCPDCNDGYNPFYPVSCYVISHSNAPLTVGIGNVEKAEAMPSFSVGPNPTDGRFQLHLDGDMGACVITIHDVSGETLRTWFFNSKDQLDAYSFDVSKLAAGTYFVKVQNKRTPVAGKVVVQQH
ncbi:MAG: peptide-N-glycosidase F-related protein [Flavobacteriales bacterium]